jgi:hypothetical protein
MEGQRSILHHLGVVWRGRDKGADGEQLPERWVDLINYLDTQERLHAPRGIEETVDAQRQDRRIAC